MPGGLLTRAWRPRLTLPSASLLDLARDLAADRRSSRDLVEAALDAASRAPQAFVRIDADAAREAASASDARRTAGRPLSALDGLPVSLKDLFDVEGQTTCAASRVLRDAPPAAADAPAVARLRAAGLVFIGRTHMSEFAFTGLGLNPHLPLLPNALDTERAPGGSSSGAAVSVALGQSVMGLGTDTGGSVRIPAAFANLVGFKPTQDRITRAGVLPLSQSLDSIGPIARTVADCRAVDAVLADAMLAAAPERTGPWRLAVPDRVVFEDLDDEVSAAFDGALRRLEAAGAELSVLPFPELDEIAVLNRRGTLSNAESFAWHRRADLLSRRELYDPEVLVRIELGAAMTAADYLDIVAGRRDTMARARNRTAPFDAVIFPTAPILPPTLAAIAQSAAFQRTNALVLRNPALVNFLGRCAVTLPMSLDPVRPAGLTLMGAAGGDAALFDLAIAIEKTAAGR